MANLRVVVWNANGLLSRRQELEQFLVQQKIDITLVTETHCTPTYALIQLRNYSVYHDVIYSSISSFEFFMYVSYL